jgi:hypothetical protein
VAGAPVLDDENARFLPDAALATGWGAGAKELRQTQAKQADSADLQELAAAQKRLLVRVGRGEVYHGDPLAVVGPLWCEPRGLTGFMLPASCAGMGFDISNAGFGFSD